MKKQQFNTIIEKWKCENAKDNSVEILTDFISVDNLYSSPTYEIARSHYNIIIESENSKSGDTIILQYNCIDLLMLDNDKNVDEIKTIDYQIAK